MAREPVSFLRSSRWYSRCRQPRPNVEEGLAQLDVAEETKQLAAPLNASLRFVGANAQPEYPVKLQVTDSGELKATTSVNITVRNVAPVVDPITVSASPIQVNTLLTATASFKDGSALDTHTIVWDWGDGIVSPSIAGEMPGGGTTTNYHAYTAPGSYTIKLTITDKDGASTERVFSSVNVYDPRPTVMYSARNYTVSESVGSAVTTVQLSEPLTYALNIRCSTRSSNASINKAFTSAPVTLTFNPGETSKTFNVPILEDSSDEPDETIILMLDNTDNGIKILSFGRYSA